MTDPSLSGWAVAIETKDRTMNVYSSKDRPFPGLQGEEFCEDARLSGEPGVAGHAQTNRSRRRLSAQELAPLTRIVNWRSAADPDIALHGGYPRGVWYLVSKLLKDLSGLTAVKTYGYFFGNPAKSTTTQSALQPVLFPHHVNYHVEHHSYPAVPHYHLRKLHDLLAARGLLGGAEVRTIGATMQMIFADPARSRTRG